MSRPPLAKFDRFDSEYVGSELLNPSLAVPRLQFRVRVTTPSRDGVGVRGRPGTAHCDQLGDKLLPDRDLDSTVSLRNMKI